MDYQNNNNNQRSQHIAPQILSQNNNQQQSQINVNQNNNPLSIPQSPLPSLFNVNHNNNLAPNYGNNQIGFVEIPNNQTGSVATENIQQPSTAPISKPNNNQQSNQFSSMPYFETNIQSQNQNINLNVEKDDLHSQLKQVINDSRPILSPNTENNGTSKKKSNSNNINDSINIVKIEQNDDEDGDDENGDDEDAETVTSTHSKQSSIYTPPKNNTNNNQPVSIIDSDEDSDVEIVNEPQNKPRRSIQNDRKRKLGESEDDDVQNNNADNSVLKRRKLSVNNTKSQRNKPTSNTNSSNTNSSNTNSSNKKSSNHPKKSGKKQKEKKERKPPPGCNFVNARTRPEFEEIKKKDYVHPCNMKNSYWWKDIPLKDLKNMLMKFKIWTGKINRDCRVFQCFDNLNDYVQCFGYLMLFETLNQLRRELTANGELAFVMFLPFQNLINKQKKEQNKNKPNQIKSKNGNKTNENNKKSTKKTYLKAEAKVEIIIASVDSWRIQYKDDIPTWQQEWTEKYQGNNNNKNKK